MQQMKMDGMALLSRIFLAHLDRVTPEEFADRELRALQCKWCADGFPVSKGAHYVLGLQIPCDANQAKASQAQRYLDTLGRIK